MKDPSATSKVRKNDADGCGKNTCWLNAQKKPSRWYCKWKKPLFTPSILVLDIVVEHVLDIVVERYAHNS